MDSFKLKPSCSLQSRVTHRKDNVSGGRWSLKILLFPLPVTCPVIGNRTLNLKNLIPLHIGATIGPMDGFGIVTISPVMALIGELVPEEHMGKAIGLLGVAYTVGVTLGPYISGAIEEHLGWSCFFFYCNRRDFGLEC